MSSDAQARLPGLKARNSIGISYNEKARRSLGGLLDS